MARTTDEVYDKVLEIHEQVLGLREDFVDLKEHVNDEVDLIKTQIDGKLDNADLLKSIGFQLLNHRFVRWGVGAVAAAIVATLASAHWLPLAEQLIHLITGY